MITTVRQGLIVVAYMIENANVYVASGFTRGRAIRALHKTIQNHNRID